MGERIQCSLGAFTDFGKGELTRFSGAARFLAFKTEIWGQLPGTKTPRGRQAVVAFLLVLMLPVVRPFCLRKFEATSR